MVQVGCWVGRVFSPAQDSYFHALLKQGDVSLRI